jgi:hypothetical protein
MDLTFNQIYGPAMSLKESNRCAQNTVLVKDRMANSSAMQSFHTPVITEPAEPGKQSVSI